LKASAPRATIPFLAYALRTLDTANERSARGVAGHSASFHRKSPERQGLALPVLHSAPIEERSAASNIWRGVRVDATPKRGTSTLLGTRIRKNTASRLRIRPVFPPKANRHRTSPNLPWIRSSNRHEQARRVASKWPARHGGTVEERPMNHVSPALGPRALTEVPSRCSRYALIRRRGESAEDCAVRTNYRPSWGIIRTRTKGRTSRPASRTGLRILVDLRMKYVEIARTSGS